MKMKFLEELKSLMLKVKLKCKIKVNQYMKILFLKKKIENCNIECTDITLVRLKNWENSSNW